MKVSTNQSQTLADALLPDLSHHLLDLKGLVNWEAIRSLLKSIKTDYEGVILFRALLLQTWYNLSDAQLSDTLTRD